MSYPLLSRNLVKPAEVITQALDDWMHAEVISSSKKGDVNEVLDDYDSAIEGFLGGPDHPKNYTWKKHNGHMDRLRLDYEAFAQTPPNDISYPKFAAKLVFDSLMELSGAYRNQCYVEAQDALDYLERRKQAVGINIGTAVTNRLVDLVRPNGDFSDARISSDGLAMTVDGTIQKAEDTITGVFEREQAART